MQGVDPFLPSFCSGAQLSKLAVSFPQYPRLDLRLENQHGVLTERKTALLDLRAGETHDGAGAATTWSSTDARGQLVATFSGSLPSCALRSPFTRAAAPLMHTPTPQAHGFPLEDSAG